MISKRYSVHICNEDTAHIARFQLFALATPDELQSCVVVELTGHPSRTPYKFGMTAAEAA